jgi:tetratricopeptide (TPR) repeat protein
MRQQNHTPAAPPSEESTARALEDYLEAAEAGAAPPRAEFLARHPELAEELDGCLAALGFIGRAARGPRSVAAGLAEVQPPEQPPGRLGDYRILREVGRGGMGVVYEAEQVSLGRRVALKVLPFAATMDPRQLQRFHNEARAAASLDHPHIVHVHAVGCERAVHFYAMQFIEGQTLAAMVAELRRAGGQPVTLEAQPTTPHVPEAPAPAAPEEDTAPQAAASTERRPLDRAYFRYVAELAIQAAEALDHAHALGIVHRDVKPANLLVDGRGGLWVTDFGLAHIQSDARLTMTGDLVGTLRYMSPEQALAKRVVVDHRTDVYSLGATLYELLTLEPAFTGNDRQELLRQIAFEEPKAPRRVNKAIPAELETIVQKAMEKNPAERYATARELADDLRRYLADEPIRARPPGAVRRLRKWGRRHPAWVAAAAAALAAAVVVLSAGIGWLANDRATRAQRTTDEISAALKESADWQQRRRVPEALAAVRRAKGALAGGHADPGLRRRVEARVHDLELLARLEEARLEGSAVNDNGFDNDLIIRRFGEIFREFHLGVEAGSAEQAGARIRDTSVALELASALDEWAALRRSVHPHDKAGWKHLLEVARAADPEGWRTKVRDALARDDRKALVALASSGEAEQLLPWTLSAVGRALMRLKSLKPAEALLRKAQQRYPGDFWINLNLAQIIGEAKDALGKAIRVDDAIPFKRVCVALRPQCAAAHNNLGYALHDKGDLDGAIAAFRKAIRLKKDYAMAHYNLGNALREKGELHAAIAEYKKAKGYAKAHCCLGIALQIKGDIDGAIAEFREAIRLKPNLAEAYYNLGNALRDKGDLHAAIAEFKRAIRLNKDYAEAHCNLGGARYDKGDIDGAIAECREAIRIRKDFAGAHTNLGLALQIKGDIDGAIAEYREAIRLKPNLAEAHNNLGNALQIKGDVDEAIAEFKRAIRLKKDYAEAHYNLGNALRGKGDLHVAIAEYKKAIRLRNDYAEAHNNLGGVLAEQKDLEGAIAEFKKAIRLKKDNAEAHNNLGNALRDKGDVDGAIAEYRAAIRLKKDDAEPHYNLGIALAAKGDVDEAIAAFRAAIRLKKDFAWFHINLGDALLKKHDVKGAIAAYREAIRLKKDFALAHYNLGIALRDKGDVDGAIAEYREAIRLKKGDAEPHFNLGIALADQKDLDGAIAEYREAIRLKKDNAEAHYNLGIALIGKGRLEEAIAEYKEAIRLKKDCAEAHCNLGHALLGKGQFAEALACLRRGHELGSKNPRWPYPSAQWVKQCERLVALEGKLPAILSGKEEPASAAESLEYAQVCQLKRLHAATARLYREAVAAQPGLVASPANGLRYNAACAAALAGCGSGEDAAQLTDAERAGLRQQALDWLRADLAAWRGLLVKEPDKSRPAVAQKMQHWLRDPDFNGVRGSAALSKLPAAERKSWRALWSNVAATLARAQPKGTPAAKKALPAEGPKKD